jgi:hypothetical protein
VADEIIARADGPNGLKAMSIKAKEMQQHEAALPAATVTSAKKPFFADAVM